MVTTQAARKRAAKGVACREPDGFAFGMWNGGHFMHFGKDIGPERLEKLIRHAYDSGFRTFMTADVYGEGAADSLLGRALAGAPRDSYCLIGAVGHDFYKGERQGEKGYPRFTDPALRKPAEYATYLQMAAEKSLERIGAARFDLLMLHNPDWTGYSSDAVWKGMENLRKQGLAGRLGIAPGPANGFTLDIIHAFETYGELIDWAMIILNPFEPWPGSLCLPAAEKHQVRVITRVVDHGGLFLDAGLKPGAVLPRTDHRSFRPEGWIEAAQEKLGRCRQIAQQHDLTLLQFAARWCLAQPAVESVVPTLLQEAGPDAKPVDALVTELAALPQTRELPAETVDIITKLGDNKGCMPLKGGSSQYLGAPQADQWPLTEKHLAAATRWKIEPDRDIFCADDTRDIRDRGAPVRGIPQVSTRRLYCQLQVFTGCTDPKPLIKALESTGLDAALYADANDPRGVGVLFMNEDPDVFVSAIRNIYNSGPFATLTLRPEFTMFGRTYGMGREENLEDWMLEKPRRNALNPAYPWAIWYPLRRRGEFELLPKRDQGRILMEHAMIGRAYGQAGYAQDIRLVSYGLDQNDNEFILGLLGAELFPLSRIVQEMRKTEQTSKYMDRLGPFFVGKVIWQSRL